MIDLWCQVRLQTFNKLRYYNTLQGTVPRRDSRGFRWIAIVTSPESVITIVVLCVMPAKDTMWHIWTHVGHQRINGKSRFCLLTNQPSCYFPSALDTFLVGLLDKAFLLSMRHKQMKQFEEKSRTVSRQSLSIREMRGASQRQWLTYDQPKTCEFWATHTASRSFLYSLDFSGGAIFYKTAHFKWIWKRAPKKATSEISHNTRNFTRYFH